MNCKKFISILISISVLFTSINIKANSINNYQVYPDTLKQNKYYLTPGKGDVLTQEFQIKVNIWGQIIKPGQYLVPSSTDLISLMSYAGGPTDNADLKKVHIIRDTNGIKSVINVDVESYRLGLKMNPMPLLQPEDMVVIPPGNYYRLSRIAQIVSYFGTVINTIYILYIIARNK